MANNEAPNAAEGAKPAASAVPHASPVTPDTADAGAAANYTYATPAAARQAIQEYFVGWSGRVTDTSFQLSLAVLAANWAVFGSAQDVLRNNWSRYSIATVVLCLGINLVGAWWMTRAHEIRYHYAEEDHARWRREFHETAGKKDPWPFTSQIEGVGRFLRHSKTVLPIAGGLLFFAAVIFG